MVVSNNNIHLYKLIKESTASWHDMSQYDNPSAAHSEKF